MIKCFKILIIAFAIHCSLPANAQWDIIYSDTIHSASISDIQFLNKDTGFAVAGLHDVQGYLLRTENGGITWDTTWFPYKLNNIFFVNDSVGYTCGFHSRVYKTLNTGNSWQLCDTTAFENQWYNFKTMWFKDENIGFVSIINTVYVTFNGGVTFSRDTALGIGTEYNLFSNTYGIWMPSANILKYTNEFGTPFQTIDTLCCNFSVISIYFNNLLHGYTAGMGWSGSPNFNYGVITKTTDGGYNWIKKDFSNVYLFADIEFVNDTIGYVVGQGQGVNYLKYRFWKTIDGGETWWYQNADELQLATQMECISCIDENLCFAAGWSGIYKTTNGGGPLISMDAAQIELNKKQISIYPNPAQTTLTISFPESYAIRNATTYKIVDKLGREVKSGKMETSSFSLLVEDLPVGLYVIIVQEDNFVEQRKFVIE